MSSSFRVICVMTLTRLLHSGKSVRLPTDKPPDFDGQTGQHKGPQGEGAHGRLFHTSKPIPITPFAPQMAPRPMAKSVEAREGSSGPPFSRHLAAFEIGNLVCTCRLPTCQDCKWLDIYRVSGEDGSRMVSYWNPGSGTQGVCVPAGPSNDMKKAFCPPTMVSRATPFSSFEQLSAVAQQMAPAHAIAHTRGLNSVIRASYHSLQPVKPRSTQRTVKQFQRNNQVLGFCP